MKRTTILLAAAILSLNAIAAANAPFAEDRYTPAGEARLKTRREMGPTCCRNAFTSATADPASNEARFRIKNGRSSPAVEARAAKSAAAETNPHIKQGRLILMEQERSEVASTQGPACEHECCRHAD